jgi:integrase
MPTTRRSVAPNKVTRTPSGRFQVKFRHDGSSTSRTFDTPEAATQFAQDGAAFGFDRAMERADERARMDGAERDRLGLVPRLGEFARSHAQAKAKANTRANYLSRVAWIEAHGIAQLHLGQVTAGDVGEFLEWLAVQPKRVGRGTLSDRSVAQVYDYLVQVFKEAGRLGWLRANPMAMVDRPEEREVKPIRAMSPDEVRAVFAHAPDPNALAFFEFLLATGARVSEAVGVTWDDVTPMDSDGFVDVHVRGTKTENADRYVTIPASVLPEPIDAWDPFLFDQRPRYAGVFRAMVDAAESAGPARAKGFEPMEYHTDDEVRANRRLLNRPTPHSLRHTHATRLFHSGAVAESAIIARIGHGDADFSRKFYVDMGEVEARHAVGRVAAALFNDTQTAE